MFFFDADTKVEPDLLKEVRKYTKSKPALIVGTVTSQKNKLISAYRVYEYGFSHRLFKTAQSHMGAITVAPGCISFYRADVMKQLDFSKKTLTEDYDLTIQIHRKKLGNIIYAPKARVITQDPPTIGDYIKQMNRWYTGAWQNMFNYKLYIPKDKLSVEVILLTLDTLVWIALLILSLAHPLFMLTMYGLSMMSMWAIAIVVILMEKQFWAIKYIPLFGIFQFLNLCIFVSSFFRTIFMGTKTLSWQKVGRYAHP
ncbi:MAG: glycosyltransferase family 2 protein [Actinomycetota bacterium]